MSINSLSGQKIQKRDARVTNEVGINFGFFSLKRSYNRRELISLVPQTLKDYKCHCRFSKL